MYIPLAYAVFPDLSIDCVPWIVAPDRYRTARVGMHLASRIRAVLFAPEEMTGQQVLDILASDPRLPSSLQEGDEWTWTTLVDLPHPQNGTVLHRVHHGASPFRFYRPLRKESMNSALSSNVEAIG